MGQWSLKERLQPSLLDRLTDLEPANTKESSSQQSMSQTQFKEAVIRDLGWLLNSVAMDVCVDLDKYPEVKSSVLNFGLPDMSGIEATREIKRLWPHVAVVALTIHEDEEYFFNMLEAGASGYVPKRSGWNGYRASYRCDTW